MWVWSYPTIDPLLQGVVMHKCSLKPEEKDEEQQRAVGLDCSYGHLANVWYYLNNVKNDGRSPLDMVCVGRIMCQLSN